MNKEKDYPNNPMDSLMAAAENSEKPMNETGESIPTNDHDPSIPSEGKGTQGDNMSDKIMPGNEAAREIEMPGRKKPEKDMPGKEQPKRDMPGEKPFDEVPKDEPDPMMPEGRGEKFVP